MNSFILVLFIIVNIICLINCLPVIHDENSTDNEKVLIKDTTENLINENLLKNQNNQLLNRSRRCALLRRIRNRLNNPDRLNLFDNGRINLLINRLNRPIIRFNDNSDDDHFNQPPSNIEANYESTNYEHVNENMSGYVNDQPNNNYIDTSNNRINNPALAPVPSAPFVETNNFVTPPNRESAVASSSVAPIETNEDWVENSE